MAATYISWVLGKWLSSVLAHFKDESGAFKNILILDKPLFKSWSHLSLPKQLVEVTEHEPCSECHTGGRRKIHVGMERPHLLGTSIITTFFNCFLL